MSGALPMYGWLHLRHEDFTGQYGKFYRSTEAQLGTKTKWLGRRAWPERWGSTRSVS